jgi:hypothetical protein
MGEELAPEKASIDGAYKKNPVPSRYHPKLTKARTSTQ